jgi:hypothetical protein
VHGGEVPFADEEYAGFAGAQHVVELVLLGAIVDGDEHAAEQRRGVVGLDVAVRVGVQRRDARATTDTEAGQQARQSPDACFQVGIGEALLLEHERHLFRSDPGRDREQTDRVHGAARSSPRVRQRSSATPRCDVAGGGRPASVDASHDDQVWWRWRPP